MSSKFTIKRWAIKDGVIKVKSTIFLVVKITTDYFYSHFSQSTFDNLDFSLCIEHQSNLQV